MALYALIGMQSSGFSRTVSQAFRKSCARNLYVDRKLVTTLLYGEVSILSLLVVIDHLEPISGYEVREISITERVLAHSSDNQILECALWTLRTLGGDAAERLTPRRANRVAEKPPRLDAELVERDRDLVARHYLHVNRAWHGSLRSIASIPRRRSYRIDRSLGQDARR